MGRIPNGEVPKQKRHRIEKYLQPYVLKRYRQFVRELEFKEGELLCIDILFHLHICQTNKKVVANVVLESDHKINDFDNLDDANKWIRDMQKWIEDNGNVKKRYHHELPIIELG